LLALPTLTAESGGVLDPTANKLNGETQMTKIITTTAFAAYLAAALISCGKLDVVGNGSIASFKELLQQVPAADNGNEWSISAPDNSARFIWSKNYAESPLYDVMIEFPAAPFIAAGLDPQKLPKNYILNNDNIIVGTKLGNEQNSGKASPLASYEQLVKLHRQAVGYHSALDHYGINLGDGNLFEWAKDMNANDKDIVFVLNPIPFTAAGTDVSKIEGWLFAPVTVDDENGKPIQLDKLLKPFNLR
jgi:hypothetical protein